MSEREAVPLSYGSNTLAPQGDPYIVSAGQAREMAKLAVKEALEEVRAERKLGRSDVGSGDIRIGELLLRHRTREEMTQKQLAALTGLHPTTIGKIENGERGMSLETFAKLAYNLEESFAWDVIDEINAWHPS
jgi:DNA-binding XRE family transcriptional regulator